MLPALLAAVGHHQQAAVREREGDAAVVDAESLGSVRAAAPAVALVAARLGTTRLIDNRELPPRSSGAG